MRNLVQCTPVDMRVRLHVLSGTADGPCLTNAIFTLILESYGYLQQYLMWMGAMVVSSSPSVQMWLRLRLLPSVPECGCV
jgi:hypothetical protein